MKRSKSLDALLNHFGQFELPINFTEDTINIYSAQNQPLSEALIALYLSKWDPEIDEYTEFIPCAMIAETEEYIALVYYKATLLKYEYILVTLDRSESLVSKKVIAGTVIENEVIKHSVARIDTDLIIHIMVGHQINNEFDPSHNKSYTMEISPAGEINLFEE